MDKQMIKELAKEIAKTLFDDCLLNNGGHCEDCECNREETKEYDCQSYLVAKKILEKYQPKIPEGAVVLTKEELEKMRQGIAAEVLAKVRTFVLDNEVGLKYLLDRTEKEYGITKGEK